MCLLFIRTFYITTGPCTRDSGSIANGNKHGTSFFVHYQCNDGYTLEGNQNITCSGGTWNSNPPQCLRKLF
jgi:hypothetical protein